MQQPVFTTAELEAAGKIIELTLRGASAADVLKTDIGRSYTRKVFEARAAARKAAS